jgi:hypothetical protein
MGACTHLVISKNVEDFVDTALEIKRPGKSMSQSERISVGLLGIYSGKLL